MLYMIETCPNEDRDGSPIPDRIVQRARELADRIDY